MTRFSALMTFLLTSLGACSEPAGSNPDDDATADVPYVRFGEEAPYRLESVGVDSATYRELADGGAGGPLLVDLGPARAEGRTIQLHIDGGGPADLYRALLGTGSAELLGGDMSILFGDTTTARIGLL